MLSYWKRARSGERHSLLSTDTHLDFLSVRSTFCGRNMEAVGAWTPQQVLDWMQGVDDALRRYLPAFGWQRVDGEKLLKLTHQDLAAMGVLKSGHQELLLEAVDLLRGLNDGVESDVLESLAGKMRLAHRGLCGAVWRRRKNPGYRDGGERRPANDFLAAVMELIAAAKSLLAWLDRTSASDFTSTKSDIVQLCLELTSAVQKDLTVYDMEEKSLQVSEALNKVCEKTSRLASEASGTEHPRVEEVRVSGVEPDEGLGIYIKSTYDGRHVVTGTIENSPADKTKRIHAGDEVVRVNEQTVAGWRLEHLVAKLRSESGSVRLLLKKRPSATGAVFAPLRNTRWRPPLVQLDEPSPRPSSDLPRWRPPRGRDAGAEESAVSEARVAPPPPPEAARNLRGDDVSPARPPVPLPVPIPVRLRQRAITGGKPRPASMPAEVLSAVSSQRGASGWQGPRQLQRYLSNEGIGQGGEVRFPPPYRRQPSLRGVDHIRGGAEVRRRDASPEKTAAAAATTGKRSASLLGGWLARLRLLSH
ncbi:connector enhancer of kinase suppressor of ras 3-like isoform X2 [Stigmatopora argus]